MLAIDKNEDIVQDIREYVTHAVQADAVEEDTLRALGVQHFDAAVIAIGSDIQSSIMITLLCKEAGVPLVVAKVQSDLHAKVLQRIGADRTIFPEQDIGIRAAHLLGSESMLDYTALTPEHTVVEIKPLPG